MNTAPIRKAAASVSAFLKAAGLLMAYTFCQIFVAVVFAVITRFVINESFYGIIEERGSEIQIISGLLFIIIVFAYLKARGISFVEAVGLKNVRITAGTFIKHSLYGVFLNLLFVIILNLLPSALTAGYGERVSDALNTGGLLMTFAVILLYSPIIEEILFRGLMLNYLKTRVNPYIAVAFISLLFGIWHGQTVWIIYTAVSGVAFSIIALKTGGIASSIITHFFFNATSLMLVLNTN